MRTISSFSLVTFAVLPGTMADFYMRVRTEYIPTPIGLRELKYYSFVDEDRGWCNTREIMGRSDVSGNKQGVRIGKGNDGTEIEINTGPMHISK